MHGSKGFVLVIYLLLLFPGVTLFFTPHQALAQEMFSPEINAGAAVLMEFSTGEIIFAHHGSEALFPASLTKVMTLILAYEALHEGQVNWEDKVTITQNAWETGGSQMFLEMDQVTTFGDLITGIATISANDACVAVAEHLYGSEASFVQEMNKKAAELGLKNTVFQNSSGLHHPQHYSSAEDLAFLSRYLISKFPAALQLHSQKEFTFNNIPQYNRNPLLDRYAGADGLKTGHTEAAGYCLIGTAAQNGMRFITVVMNNCSPKERLKDSETLLNYAFRNYTLCKIFAEKEVITEIKVSKGKEREVELKVEEPLEVVVPFNRQDDLEISINTPENVTAPLQEGEALGHVEVHLDGKLLQKAPLYIAKGIDKAGLLSLLCRSTASSLENIWSKFLETIQNLVPTRSTPVISGLGKYLLL